MGSQNMNLEKVGIVLPEGLNWPIVQDGSGFAALPT